MVECDKTRKWPVGSVGRHGSFGMRPQIWRHDGPKTTKISECEGSRSIDTASWHLRWLQFLQNSEPFWKIPFMTILRVYGTPPGPKNGQKSQKFDFQKSSKMVILRVWGVPKISFCHIFMIESFIYYGGMHQNSEMACGFGGSPWIVRNATPDLASRWSQNHQN